MREFGPVRARRLKVASLRRRCAAGLIDTTVLLVPLIASSVAVGWLYVTYARRRGSDTMGKDRMARPRRVGYRWTLVIAAVSLPLQLQIRNSRTPGYRALGLRRVDAQSGGPVSIRSTLINVAVTTAWGELTRLLVAPLEKRRREALGAVDAEIKEALRVHAGNPEAAQRAVIEVYQRHDASPARSCLPAVAAGLLLQLPALWSPLNQTIPERLAGTVVVED